MFPDDPLADQRAAFAAVDNGCGLAGLSDDAPATYDESCNTLTVTFTATDICGLTSTTEASFTVRDLVGPVITPPVTDVTLFCDGVNDPIQMIQNYADNLTAVDDCGNTTLRSATVSIPHDFKVLARIATQWLRSNPSGKIPEDLNGDGIVNLLDFARFADNWIK